MNEEDRTSKKLEGFLRLFLAVALAFCVQSSWAAENQQEQIEALRWFIAHDPKDPELHLPQLHEALGHLLLGAEVEVTEEAAMEAEHHLRRAVELDPTLYWAWYDLAILHMDTEEGDQYLKNAIAANPEFPEPYYWLAYTYARNRRDAEAIPIFERYLEVAHDNPNEDGRMEAAGKLLIELRTGIEGEALLKVRRPSNLATRDLP